MKRGHDLSVCVDHRERENVLSAYVSVTLNGCNPPVNYRFIFIISLSASTAERKSPPNCVNCPDVGQVDFT